MSDGPSIHMLKAVTRDRNKRVVETRCGIKIEEPYSEPLTAGTGSEDRVTCPDCHLPPKGTS